MILVDRYKRVTARSRWGSPGGLRLVLGTGRMDPLGGFSRFPPLLGGYSVYPPIGKEIIVGVAHRDRRETGAAVREENPQSC